MAPLPPVGSSELLKCLSPYVPDDLVRELLPRRRGRGRPAEFGSHQLLRTLLLSTLTPARSFNMLCRLLPDNRAWCRFALLSPKRSLPGPRVLHEFRQKLSPSILRTIHVCLLSPLLVRLRGTHSIALIDATDLPAATNAYKKTLRESSLLIGRAWGAAV